MFSRVSTNNNHIVTIDSLNRRQSSLAETQRQISSGEQYNNFADIAKDGQTRRVIDFSSSLDQITNYQKNNQLLDSRLEGVSKSLSTVLDINTKAIAAMVQERSGLKDDNLLRQQLQASLQQIEDQLNKSIGGRYVFAGADTTTRPVDSLLTSNLNDDNEPTDNYYNGDGTDLSQRVSADVVIEYGVRANDPAIQKLIGALHLAIEAEDNNDDAKLATAIDLANEAQKEVNGLRSLVGNNQATLQTVREQHDNFKTYYKSALENITGTDVAEASIQLSLDQAILTASFQAFARVSNLTLGQYLR